MSETATAAPSVGAAPAISTAAPASQSGPALDTDILSSIQSASSAATSQGTDTPAPGERTTDE